MAPDEIEGREFFVSLRGYDKNEVHHFLAEVADEQRQLLAELDALRSAPPQEPAPAARDDFESMGANVAAILRSAKEAAAAMELEAAAAAATIRQDAERYAEERRRAADEYALAKRDEANGFHGVAERAANDAAAEADRRVAEAEARVTELEAEAAERARVATEAVLADAAKRLAEASRTADDTRERLLAATDEIQLAVLALGDPLDDEGAAQHLAATIDLSDHEQDDVDESHAYSDNSR